MTKSISERFALFFALLLLAGAALEAGIPQAAQVASAATLSAPTAAGSSRYFAATGHTVAGGFLSYFDAHGGVRVFGLPLSDEMNEGGRTVQYFERQRFEYHPENGGTHEVLLGLLGVEFAKARGASLAPAQPKAGVAYVAETGHNLAGAFLDFWRANGGVAVLGYPITEQLQENGLAVQYFQRARMEYHPEAAAQGFGVLLGLLGRDYVAAHPSVTQAIAAGGQPSQASQTTQAAPVGHAMNALERDLFDRINGARAAAGMQPVAYDGRIGDLALYRSNDMASKGYFSHQPPDGRNFITLLNEAGIPYKLCSEIITWNTYGEDQTALKGYEWFMGSATHRGAILTPQFNAAGVGQSRDASGKYIFTVIFVQR